jgi:hypothetical protein
MCKLKTVLIANITLFSIVGIFHLVRAISGWNLVTGPLNFPAGYSYLAVVLLGGIVYLNWRNLK